MQTLVVVAHNQEEVLCEHELIPPSVKWKQNLGVAWPQRLASVP
jgi:hypothetical protein